METLYATIYHDILQDIISGNLKPGDRVHSEKELSEKYGVSRITAKKALDMLCAEGHISRSPGRGSFVCDRASESGTGKAVAASKTIGLIMEDFSENFGVFIISGAERACGEAGYSLIIKRTFGSQKAEKDAINELREKGVSGLLILPVHGDNYNEAILKLVLDRFPTVLLDRQLKGIPISFVGTDNYTAAKKLSDYLFEKGHAHICFVSPPADDTSSVTERIAGFVKSNEERGILTERYIMSSVRGTLPGKGIDESLLSDSEEICRYLCSHSEVTGILAVEYNIALTALHAIESMGKSVPEDYEIVCFDGPENYIQRYELTHARQDEEGIGKESVRILLEQFAGRREVQKVELPAAIKEKYAKP